MWYVASVVSVLNYSAWLLFWIQGMKEAMIITGLGYKGIWVITGKEKDHSLWIYERTAIAIMVVSGFALGYLFALHYIVTLNLFLIAFGIGLSYFFMHDGGYYDTYNKLMGHYPMGVKDFSLTTTSRHSYRYPVRLFMISVGIVGQVLGLLLL